MRHISPFSLAGVVAFLALSMRSAVALVIALASASCGNPAGSVSPGRSAALAPDRFASVEDRGADDNECQAPERFLVGHAIKRLNVAGTLGENRPLDVELWYPAREVDDCFDQDTADAQASEDGPRADDPHCTQCIPAVYQSRLRGVPLFTGWDPLAWVTNTNSAFDNAPVADGRFPVIVFSHGNSNNAYEHAYMLEALASYGYIVAAPDHLGNTQDDVRIDFVNTNAKRQVLACMDGLASPCSRADVAKSMTDRKSDVTAVLDVLPVWFKHRADMNRVGVLGHSRGSVTGLAVAGGSKTWGFTADKRVKAIMGLSIGAPSITFSVDINNISVPALLVAGSLDKTAPPSISQAALLLMSSKDKKLELITNAVHRHFDSALCAEMQSSGAIAQGTATAKLDRHTANYIIVSPNAPVSGVGMDFCAYDSFTNPTDIRPIVKTLSGFDVTATNVPAHGLTSAEVKDDVINLATTFFGRVLNRADDDDRPFSDCLDDRWKGQPEPEINQADFDEAELHVQDED